MRAHDHGSMTSRIALAIVIVFAFAVLASSRPARLHADAVGAMSTVPLFAIRKSENRNQVQYAIRLDPECRPQGRAPVVVYWRMLERGPAARESLEVFEQRAYGIARQRTSTDGAGARVDVMLRALRGRSIVVRVERAAGRCTARATTLVEGVECTIEDVFVAQRGPMSVDYVEIRGRAVVGGEERVERERR